MESWNFKERKFNAGQWRSTRTHAHTQEAKKCTHKRETLREHCTGQRWVTLSTVRDSAESRWALCGTVLSQAEHRQGRLWIKPSTVRESDESIGHRWVHLKLRFLRIWKKFAKFFFFANKEVRWDWIIFKHEALHRSNKKLRILFSQLYEAEWKIISCPIMNPLIAEKKSMYKERRQNYAKLSAENAVKLGKENLLKRKQFCQVTARMDLY